MSVSTIEELRREIVEQQEIMAALVGDREVDKSALVAANEATKVAWEAFNEAMKQRDTARSEIKTLKEIVARHTEEGK